MSIRNDLCHEVFSTIRKIIRAVDVHSKKLNSVVGVTGPQLVILDEIKRKKKITTTELAENISLSQSTATSILDRLVDKELVIRNRDIEDKRKWFLELAPRGNTILKKSPGVVAPSFIEGFNSLPKKQQSQMLEHLRLLATMLNEERDVQYEDALEQ